MSGIGTGTQNIPSKTKGFLTALMLKTKVFFGWHSFLPSLSSPPELELPFTSEDASWEFPASLSKKVVLQRVFWKENHDGSHVWHV